MSSPCRDRARGLAATVAGLALIAGPLGACRPDPERVEQRVESASVAREPAGAVQTSDLTAGRARVPPELGDRFAGDRDALESGRRLYQWFNCAGCHGAIGGGAIGPPLADTDWIYGATSTHVYRSIYEGRPEGMPAFGGRIPDDELWKLVAFVHSLGSGTPTAEQASTPRFDPDRAPGEQPQAPEQDPAKAPEGTDREGGDGAR